jgi:hypothetical protein
MELYSYRAEIYGVPAGEQSTPLPDVTGWNVESRDGDHLGKVDEATFETSSSCLVVDTGFWIFGKKRMIPAGVVDRLDRDEKIVYVSMTKDQIKDAPDYDPDRHSSDETGYHREVGEYYGQYGQAPASRGPSD